MKIRKGYVSNSSSSSFVCEVCGEIKSGYDVSFSDMGMVRCTRGHVICEHHIQGDRYSVSAIYSEVKRQLSEGYPEVAEFLETSWPTWEQDMTSVDGDTSIDDVMPAEVEEEDFWDYLYEYDSYNMIPTVCCPICTITHVNSYDLLTYLIKRTGQPRQQLEDEIRDRFKTYEKFKEYLKDENQK